MTENNHLANGQFLHNLDNWLADGASYSAGDGDEHYGVAVLPSGGAYIEQTFSVPRVRAYSLHLALKAVGAGLSAGQAKARIVDGDDNVVVEQDLSGAADTWATNEFTYGLAPGTTYTLLITNHSAAGDVKVDDVWLWHTPMTRSALAARVHVKLARLATDRSLSLGAVGDRTEGDYTYAVDAGLRAIGAVNPDTGSPDVRYLDPEMVNAALDGVEREMLERLRRDYAVEVDISLGPRRESLSQVGQALADMAGAAGKGEGARVTMGTLRHAGYE